jgi:putative redox protein
MTIWVRTDGGLRTEATDGNLTSVMDEPVEAGGTGEGMSPVRALLAALGGCTAITLKLYSARKDWPLEDVAVRVELDEPDGGAKRIRQYVELKGDLDDAQRERLRQIAGRCPVHRMLEGPVAFEEHLADEV